MLVSITSVTTSRAPKGYSIAEVSYLREGKEESKKLMSFVDENLFKTITSFDKFPVDVNVVLAKERSKKDGKEYWQWKNIETGPVVASYGATQPPAKSKVIGSNYETPAERARRQVYIVRQSSLANAVAFYAAVEPKGVTIDSAAIIELADKFANYVLDVSEEPNVE